jgi:hypothetical protein
LNLSWSECGSNGAANREFACDTNVGGHVLVGSIVAPANVGGVTNCENYLTVQFDGPVPQWWMLRNAGTCRQSSISVDFIGGLAGCTDYWIGYSGGFTSYLVGPFGDPRQVRIIVSSAIPTAQATEWIEGQAYFAFKLVIDNAKTVGDGICAGCGLGATITYDRATIRELTGAPYVSITNESTRRAVTWQGSVLPVKSRTWGAIKALYR